jgi:hypothetical protein
VNQGVGPAGCRGFQGLGRTVRRSVVDKDVFRVLYVILRSQKVGHALGVARVIVANYNERNIGHADSPGKNQYCAVPAQNLSD